MQQIRTALLQIAMSEPAVRVPVLAVTRQAKKWSKLPKGWTQDSVEKFWNTLTGDNKHKVTKCIKQMEGKGGVDDPGAFCASLADKVMGTGWRHGPRKKQGNGDMLQYFADNPDKLAEKLERDKKKKKAGQPQIPNPIDTAAARFRDRMEASVNESYRTSRPNLIPPTMNLLHGQKWMRLILSDGELNRDALAFISRDTGQVYLAGGWDQPLPFPVANVLEVETWGDRTAFDQYQKERRRQARLVELRTRQARLELLRAQGA